MDIFPILRDPIAFETLIAHLTHRITSHTIPNSSSKKIDVVVGLDARGFLLGPIIALRLGAAFVPVRKRGKLPGQCVSATYEKEYGTVSQCLSMSCPGMIITTCCFSGFVRNARGLDQARSVRCGDRRSHGHRCVTLTSTHRVRFSENLI